MDKRPKNKNKAFFLIGFTDFLFRILFFLSLRGKKQSPNHERLHAQKFGLPGTLGQGQRRTLLVSDK